MSGGLSKLLKSENPQKSRINKVNANYSMYDQLGNSSKGFSPEKGEKKHSQLVQHLQNNQNPKYSSTGQNYPSAKIQSGKSQGLHQTGNKSFDGHHSSIQSNSMLAQKQGAPNSTMKQGQNSNAQAYDELKKRLLNEYKKLCTNKKSFDEQVRERYKSLKQRSASGKKTSS